MDKAAVLAEIDAVFVRCGTTSLKPECPMRPGSRRDEVDGNWTEFVTTLSAAIERYATQELYVTTMRTMLPTAGQFPNITINKLMGILSSVRKDIDDGFVRTLERRTQDEVFDDLLEMADEIVKMHAAPAVVLAVSVLEERVRGLATANGIVATKGNGDARSFEDLITDLFKAKVLTKPEFRSMGGWYAQRTEAAHGHFANVTAEDVPRIVSSVRDFLARHP